MDGDRVVYSTSDGALTRHWNVPSVNTAALLLGAGTSLTNAATRRLAEERVLVAFTGSGGTPIFMGSLSEYAPTDHLRAWISFWQDEAARLRVATFFSQERCDSVLSMWKDLSFPAAPDDLVARFRNSMQSATTIEALRGSEGDFAKELYRVAAKATSIEWTGRATRSDDDKDLANHFLDQGNYLAYGLAGVVLWALGIPPGLAVSHGATRAGGLVFDLADVVKDAIVLPTAFKAAAAGNRSQDFRDTLVDDMDRLQVLPLLFDVFLRAITIGTDGTSK